MKNLVIVVDSFKGSCTTFQAADAIEKGFNKVFVDLNITKIPIADGGEGTVDALVTARSGKFCNVEVFGPLGKVVDAKYGIIDENIAIIEMASASGLELLDENERDAGITTTYGTGQLIKSALDAGCRKIYIGIGGSATNDGGMGMAQALGVSFEDKNGKELGYGGYEISRLVDIKTNYLDKRIYSSEIIIMSDVSNPLCGLNGASYIYGPQKGANVETMHILDQNLTHYAEVIKSKLKLDVLNIPGSGAAGGLGAGLIVFCNAKIHSGIDEMLNIINIDKYLKNADLVLTGEGRIDEQTAFGKVPVGIAKRAKKYGVPTFAIVGSVGIGFEAVFTKGIDYVIDIIDKPMTLNEAMINVENLIEKAAENTARVVKLYTSK